MKDLSALLKKSNSYNAAVLEIDFTLLPEKGYYFWFANKNALKKMNVPICKNLSYVNNKDVKYFLCYIGIGPSSKNSKETLTAKIRNKHLHGSIRNSTFRKSISALLNLNDKKLVSAFIQNNFRICISEHVTPWTIESELIKFYTPPLNLDNGWLL